MLIEEALLVIDEIICSETGENLNDLKQAICRGIFLGQKYELIAANCRYSHVYVRNLASNLLDVLSNRFQSKVTQKNLIAVLERNRKISESNNSTLPDSNAAVSQPVKREEFLSPEQDLILSRINQLEAENARLQLLLSHSWLKKDEEPMFSQVIY